jgi:hypothetical protein
MEVKLTFQDFAKLAANQKVEKDGVTLTFERPVLSEGTFNPGKGGKVVFFLDETDPRSGAEATA